MLIVANKGVGVGGVGWVGVGGGGRIKPRHQDECPFQSPAKTSPQSTIWQVMEYKDEGAGIAQWLERRTRD